MIDWWWTLAAFPPGAILGYGTATLQNRRGSPPPADIARFMNRVVNQEELEEHERITKFRMARNGRKTQRFDSGPNARIGKMPVTRVGRRHRRP